MTTKADYVRSQGQTRDHHCHWPGCRQQVPPAQWGCSTHWYKVPKHLRDLIWATYKPGQEIDGTPSQAYLDAADKVQVWIAENTPKPAAPIAGQTHSLARGDDKLQNCAECGAAGNWKLTRLSDGYQWQLCASHAAGASHKFGILHRAMNPTGAKS